MREELEHPKTQGWRRMCPKRKGGNFCLYNMLSAKSKQEATENLKVEANGLRISISSCMWQGLL